MSALDDIKHKLRAEKPYLRERYRVDQIGICGSFTRGEETESSDVDLLVSFSDTPDLLEFVNLKRHLTKVVGREVDIGMASALKEGPAAHNIHREVQYL